MHIKSVPVFYYTGVSALCMERAVSGLLILSSQLSVMVVGVSIEVSAMWAAFDLIRATAAGFGPHVGKISSAPHTFCQKPRAEIASPHWAPPDGEQRPSFRNVRNKHINRCPSGERSKIDLDPGDGTSRRSGDAPHATTCVDVRAWRGSARAARGAYDSFGQRLEQREVPRRHVHRAGDPLHEVQASPPGAKAARLRRLVWWNTSRFRPGQAPAASRSTHIGRRCPPRRLDNRRLKRMRGQSRSGLARGDV